MSKKTLKNNEVTELIIEFETLAKDTEDFAETLSNVEYREFVKRIAANIKLYGERFKAFTKAAGMISE